MQMPTQIGPASNHLRWDDKPQANQITMMLLQDILVRHSFEDVLQDVPPNHVDYKRIDLPPKLRRMYNELANTCRLALEKEDVTAVHAAALRTKLLQLCSGAVYSSPDTYHVLDPFRYELIADLVEERDHRVVFFNWHHQRDLLSEHFRKRGISFQLLDSSVSDTKKTEYVRRYQTGEYRTLLIHPKTGAHGLTLTRGTTSIVSSPIYEPDYLKQLIHRIYRGGQTQATNTLLVSANNTVEELVYQKLNAGTLRMNDFLELICESTKA
jgi:SNF2 family DNA or RNA helicase